MALMRAHPSCQLSKVKINDQQNQLPFVVDFQPAVAPYKRAIKGGDPLIINSEQLQKTAFKPLLTSSCQAPNLSEKLLVWVASLSQCVIIFSLNSCAPWTMALWQIYEYTGPMTISWKTSARNSLQQNCLHNSLCNSPSAVNIIELSTA